VVSGRSAEHSAGNREAVAAGAAGVLRADTGRFDRMRARVRGVVERLQFQGREPGGHAERRTDGRGGGEGGRPERLGQPGRLWRSDCAVDMALLVRKGMPCTP